MKTLAITTALIASLAAPAFANNTVANAIFTQQAAADDETHLYRSVSGGEVVSTQSFGPNGVASDIFAEFAEQDDELHLFRTGGNEVLSTQSFGNNSVAAQIFAAERASSLENE